MLKRFLYQENKGSIAIEFVILLPVFIFITLISIDLSRYILTNMRVERTAYTVGNFVTKSIACQDDNLNANRLDKSYLLNNITLAAETLKPLDINTDAKVIISSVTKQAGAIKFYWQSSIGGSALTNTSPLGTIAADSSYLDGVANVQNLNSSIANGMLNGDNVIASEVYAQFTPMFLNIPFFSGTGLSFLSANTISSTTYFAPRNGNFEFLPPYSTINATSNAATLQGCI
jgi:Flp pilus assembly protein TadG